MAMPLRDQQHSAVPECCSLQENALIINCVIYGYLPNSGCATAIPNLLLIRKYLDSAITLGRKWLRSACELPELTTAMFVKLHADVKEITVE
jgi:hypothetical protein